MKIQQIKIFHTNIKPYVYIFISELDWLKYSKNESDLLIADVKHRIWVLTERMFTK